ncbi:A/G-specific adenine glycosylase [Spelaeicoccus albus]|uniref:Adenine DNA glycosylase n=1 Tax=Spelaeicoccus albus TaxID=1280376 RepID=A0A7Z0IJD1_9MICO|nr:A/G-specific adenine glycosylase [Spelaeicoccus albus]NYI69409.1 A/G-specific adenine glycosylase [Spelaeicoccus albus]
MNDVDASALRRKTVRWYGRNARDLPWRHSDCSPWGVLVSEFMLQQTPVARVLPVWRSWVETYPAPADLAAAPTGDAVRAWGRLGYPRRALRLHAAATAIVRDHGGEVPPDNDALLALPGVGRYTAAAVASFAFQQAHPVLDTNIRRVLGRVLTATPEPSASPSAAEYALAARLLPATGNAAARWNSAVMELGALVCTARTPRCDDCPLRTDCAWLRAGRPAAETPGRPRQAWHGTDRQLRGAIMAVLRAGGPVVLENFRADPASGAEVPEAGLGAAQIDALARLRDLNPDDARVDRLIGDLCADGLAVTRDGSLSLPQ